jgi:hypothetical protein
MKLRVLVGLMSPVVTPLILTACHLVGSSEVIVAPPAVIAKVGTDPASVVAGASFSDSIRVRVTDSSNFPVLGLTVEFAVTAGGGSVTPTEVITDVNGQAAAKFITGTTAGTNTATATVGGLPAVTFSTTTVAAGTIIWSSIPMDTLRGVWGSSASDVWAVGASGAIRHYNGAIWSGVMSGTSQPLAGIWGTSASDMWAVGGFSGTILHYNGTSWSSLLERAQPGILFAVWGSSASDVWVGGDADSVFHYNGASWSAVGGVTRTIFGIWGSSASDVWAVGYNGSGTIFHYDGTLWSSVAPGTTQGLNGAWGSSASDVWAVGDNGAIVHYNGTSWSTVASGTSQSLLGVWGSSASDVWAVGNGGAMLHYDGTGWSSSASGTTQNLFDIWGSSGTDLWAVGTAGLLHGQPAGDRDAIVVKTELNAIRDLKTATERDPRSEKLKISGGSHRSLTVPRASPVTHDRLYRSATQICRNEVSKPWYLALLRSRITFF